ncbi:MAG: multicopper oxidase domain-containing protein [Candidatus Omnitrophica bacterium]|nr:multicopper oxidase domain-containing protein [Candidatus Omnitrophota bacterium]
MAILLILNIGLTASAAEVEYSLTIEKTQVNITKDSALAMTINGEIPGPVLNFVEGDVARISVENRMDVETSIHWHGLLLPPGMDGVPYLTYPPIKPGETFVYEFPIRQSGTYWYHSHTMFQEQRGVYGSIVIEPRKERREYDKDYVVMLSDWTDEDPHSVMRTLKRGSEWYAVQKGAGQSILGAAKKGMLKDYFTRELQRMPPMDLSDIAYDRFLINGQSESALKAVPGDIVRLRIINGSASTFFYVEYAAGPMTIISADGQDVEPLQKSRLLIGVAETYDVLVMVPESGAFEFRATAHDGSALARVWVGEGIKRYARDVPKANLYSTMGGMNLKQLFALTPAGVIGMPTKNVEMGMYDKPGMAMDMGEMDMDTMNRDSMGVMQHDSKETKGSSMDHSMMMPKNKKGSMSHNMMDHSKHETMSGQMESDSDAFSGKKYSHRFGLLTTDISSRGSLVMDGMEERPWPPYDELRSLKPTGFADEMPVREVRLTLDGDMERYVWSMNGLPLEESDYIKIKEGEVVRFIMINRTMMHHPMHLHGHFFRVVNAQGDYSPLKHTVDVMPMSTTVIEFNANEVGDWFFHCHLLYHMMSGMARVVSYENFQPPPEVASIRSKLNHNEWYFYGQGDFLSQMTQGQLVATNYRNILSAQWEYGWQDVPEDEWEGIFTWDRYFNRFFTVFAGVDVLGEGDEEKDTRGIFGLRYLLPMSIHSTVWVDSEGGSRFALDKEWMMTPRISIDSEVEYDTHSKWEGQAGVSYLINKDFTIKGLWHSDFGPGGGVQIRF